MAVPNTFNGRTSAQPAELDENFAQIDAATANANAAADAAQTAATVAQDDHGHVRTIATSTHTLTNADHNDTLTITHVDGCTVTHPAGLRSDFACVLVQGAAGPITMNRTGGVTYYPAADGTTAQDQFFVIMRRHPTLEQYVASASPVPAPVGGNVVFNGKTPTFNGKYISFSL